MTLSQLLRSAACAAAFLAVALPGVAQDKQSDAYQPSVGQPGKDVIWVPTPDDVVERMLQMAQTTAKDVVADLGSGDGKIVITAARLYGARAFGIEYNPDMVKHAQRNARSAGVGEKVSFQHGDIFVSDFSQATVITLYLLPDLNLKLRPRLLAMRPGTRVVSHSFHMDDWEADETSVLDARRAYFWVIPAQVKGRWIAELSGSEAKRYDLQLEQKYQKVEGTVALARGLGGLRELRLRGDAIHFAFVDERGVRREFDGRVSGAKIEGSWRGDGGLSGRWQATKQ